MGIRTFVQWGGALVLAAALLPGTGWGQSATEFHMLERMERVDALRMGIVSGDIERARPPAAWLARERPEDLQLEAEYQAYLARMRQAASDIVADWSVDDAAQELGGLGAACGACHSESGAGLAFNPPPRPEESSELNQHMALHLWAVDRLWEGLVGPSDDSWALGAEALAGAHLDREETTAPAGRRYRAEAFAELVHETGELATGATPDQRADIFSQLITACVGCHNLIQAQPGG